MAETTPGKFHHLQRCAPGGAFNILALDHRRNLWESLAKHETVDDFAFGAFKNEVLQELSPHATAALTDPRYGLQYLMGVPGYATRGLLLPLEVTDYSLHPSRRTFNPIPGWSVEHIKRVGGDGVKLLLYYHPDDANAAGQRAVVENAVAECARHDIPLFLEPIAFSPDPAQALSAEEHTQVVVESARMFCAMGIDVLKAEYPALPDADETAQEAALHALNAVCVEYEVPWALLSAGVSYPVFFEQVKRACAAGASGVIVGRAIWGEAVALQGQPRTDFLAGEGARRMRELGQWCETWAEGVWNVTQPPTLEGEWWRASSR